MSSLLGISGKRGSGKDAFKDLLNRELLELGQEPYTSRSFGDILKECASVITGVDVHRFHSQEGKAMQLRGWDMSLGEFLQKLGDGVRKTVHPDTWILAAFNPERTRTDVRTVNPSVRYTNEARAIQKRGGVLVRIEGNPVAQQGDGTRDDTHPSEVELDDYRDFDIVVRNNGTLEELRLAALQVARHLTTGLNPRICLVINASERNMFAADKRHIKTPGYTLP